MAASSHLPRVHLLRLAWAAVAAAGAYPSCSPSEADSACRAPTLIQFSPSVSRKSYPGVLFMVKAYSGFYSTRLRAVLETWAAEVNRSNLLVIGDEEAPEMAVRRVAACGDDATQGLSCRVAHGVVLAAQHRGDWSWLVVVDDDHYVRPGRVQAALAQFDAGEAVAAGCYGCGRPQYCEGFGGLCGGCGYAFSRAAVHQMVGDPPADFLELHRNISHSPLSEGREDMAISCVLHRRVPRLQIKQLGEFRASAPDLASPTEATADDDTAIWHAISPELMRRIHRRYQGVDESG